MVQTHIEKWTERNLEYVREQPDIWGKQVTHRTAYKVKHIHDRVIQIQKY